jgi:hypothetical protein
MDREAFRDLLDGFGYTEEQRFDCLSGVELFEEHLRQRSPARTLEEADGTDARAFAADLIERELNQRNRYVGLYHYAGMIGNHPMQIGVLELFDGYEILGNLHRFIGEELGEKTQRAIFDGVELPVLGTSPLQWTRVTSAIMPRLEALADRETVERILHSGLRNQPDDRYLDFKARYEEIGDIDAFLEDRGVRHLDRLIEHAENGTPYFNQMIDQDVLDFVRRTPEIGRGVREGNTIIEVKIPHQTIEYLSATDPRAKQYHVCHCPCVKESILRDDLDVSPTFCSYCPSFNAKPWEVTFGQRLQTEVLESGLRGGLWCKFAIHLPEGAV